MQNIGHTPYQGLQCSPKHPSQAQFRARLHRKVPSACAASACTPASSAGVLVVTIIILKIITIIFVTISLIVVTKVTIITIVVIVIVLTAIMVATIVLIAILVGRLESRAQPQAALVDGGIHILHTEEK